MRSLSNFQNDQANLLLMNAAKDRRLSSLSSQFMDMFDASKLDTSLLRKREFQGQDNFLQKELQKKIKTSLNNNDLTRPSSIPISNFSSMLYNRNYQINPINPLLNALSQDQPFGSFADQVKQLQNISLLKQQQDAFLALQPLTFPTQLGLNSFQPESLLLKKNKLNLKEEYVKQEELPTTQASPFKSILSDNQTTNDRLSENSPVNTEVQNSSLEVGEPALVDFTREFPDWDLATIFGYIKSGKSREVFEKEKQFKMERKLRRQKLRMANKEKGVAAKQRKTKGKKAVESDE